MKKYFLLILSVISFIPMSNLKSTIVNFSDVNDIYYLQPFSFEFNIEQTGYYPYSLIYEDSDILDENGDVVKRILDSGVIHNQDQDVIDTKIHKINYTCNIFNQNRTGIYYLKVDRIASDGTSESFYSDHINIIPTSFIYDVTDIRFNYKIMGATCNFITDNKYISQNNVIITSNFINDIPNIDKTFVQDYTISYDENIQLNIFSFKPMMKTIGKVYFNFNLDNVYSISSDTYNIGFNGINLIVDSLENEYKDCVENSEILNRKVDSLGLVNDTLIYMYTSQLDSLDSLRNRLQVSFELTTVLNDSISILNDSIITLNKTISEFSPIDTLFNITIVWNKDNETSVEYNCSDYTSNIEKIIVSDKSLRVPYNENLIQGIPYRYKLIDMQGNQIDLGDDWYLNDFVNFGNVSSGTYVLVFMQLDNEVNILTNTKIIVIE